MSTIGGTATATTQISFGANLPSGASIGSKYGVSTLIYDSLGNPSNISLDYTKAAEGKKIVVLRLWNSGGADTLNSDILQKIKNRFPATWRDTRGGKQIGNNVYIQFGDKFDWPDIDGPIESDTAFCYGLRDQIGVLCDGTVVPCCLDNNGEINLGNIFESNLGDIINSPRALNIYNGFSNRKACEELCKKCTFARKF